MTSNQRKLFDLINFRISKKYSVALSLEICCDYKFGLLALEKLKNGSDIEVFNVLWALRNLGEEQLNIYPSLCEVVLVVIDKYPQSNSVQRDGLGLLQQIFIPAELEGKVYDFAFKNLMDSSKPIATTAFSMTVCYNLAKFHLDLLKELEIQIKDILLLKGDTSPAIYSRGNAILHKISRHLRK